MASSAPALGFITPKSWIFPDGLHQAIPTIPVGIYRKHQLDYVDQFNQLVSQWRLEILFSSSVQDKIQNALFKQIVDMGEKIIPLIVAELKYRPDFLFLALQLITKENPVPPNVKGNVGLMIDAWLDWANQNHINAD